MTELSGNLEDAGRQTAMETVPGLLAKHGIDGLDGAHRLIRERFSDDELRAFKSARDVLDGMGAIG